MSSAESPDVNLRVLYDFEYATKDERKVCITEGERLFLIKKTNPDWWQVIRSSRERPFFVPAKYVEIFDVENNKLRRESDEIGVVVEENGNASSESVDVFRDASETSPRDGLLDESPTAVGDFDAHLESQSEDVRRILFDRRKSWAVEELLSELTQGRPAPAPKPAPAPEPAPEPEPDYDSKDEISLDEDGNVLTAASTVNTDNLTTDVSLSTHCRILSQKDFIDKIDLSPSIQHSTSDKNADSNSSAKIEADFYSARNEAQVFNIFKTPPEVLFKVPQVPNYSKDCQTSVVSIDGVGSALVKVNSVKSNSGSARNNSRVYSNVSIVKRDSIGSDSGSLNGSYARLSDQTARDLTKRDSVRSDTGSVESRGSYARVTLLDDAKGSRVNVNEDIATSTDEASRSQRTRKGPKVTQLSESLERLAQQIQFGPAVTTEKPSLVPWVKKPSRSFEEDTKADLLSRSYDELDASPSDEDIFSEDKVKTYPNKMFLKVKNKIQHSSSFKTKKEMEKAVRKRYYQDKDGFDVRASVSGNVTVDADMASVAFSVLRNEKDDALKKEDDKVTRKTEDEVKPTETDSVIRTDKDDVTLKDGSVSIQKEKISIPPKEKGKIFNIWHKEKDKILSTLHKDKDIASNKAKEVASQRGKEDEQGNTDARPSVLEIQQSLQAMSEHGHERRSWRDILLETHPGGGGGERRLSRDNLDVIGEANILRDEPLPAAPSPHEAKLTQIAIGFQNPSYRPISHSLDNFHDPAVLAMHDKLCTALGERHNDTKQSSSIATRQHDPQPHDATQQQKTSRWSRLRQLSVEADADTKTRNFHKLKTAIERANVGIPDISVTEHVGDVAAESGEDRKDRDRKYWGGFDHRGNSKEDLRDKDRKLVGGFDRKFNSKEDLMPKDKAVGGFDRKFNSKEDLVPKDKDLKAVGGFDRKFNSKEDLGPEGKDRKAVSSFERKFNSKEDLWPKDNERKASESLDELVFGGGKKPADSRSRSGSNTSDDAVLNGEGGRRKPSLSRTGRVESIRERHQLKLPLLRPPSPSPDDHPSQQLADGWAEYHTPDGRTYYHCGATGGKSWKPPRRHGLNSESEDGNGSPTLGITVPNGWQEGVDDESGLPIFTHHSGAKWFSSSDVEGRLYFFEENSANSSWTLPSIPGSEAGSPAATTIATTIPTPTPATTNPAALPPAAAKPSIASIVSSLLAEKRRDEQAVTHRAQLQLEGKSSRMLKTRSMVLVPPTYDDKSPTLAPPNWPHLFEGNMKIMREGAMHRTKITEHGKKVRKNWNQSYVVLTELFLLFYSDIKHAIAMKNGVSAVPPELCVDLSGANIERADKLSSRKNVFVVSTQLGHQVLIQCDSSKTAELWYHSIHTVIALLPRNENSPILVMSSPDVVKKPSRLGYSRSMRIKKDGSMEDLTANPEERQTKIRARLKKFFVRRPTKESLVKKGIYKDEPMFGRNLSDVILPNATVPQFVVHCIDVIESKEENMKADGLYRVSGNLSQVQKIRLQADQNNLLAIDQEEDVHVLTGALKLFFRELKKPLIPCEHFSKALKASSNPNKQERLQQFRDIVKALPVHNRSTLQYLLQHLLRVAKFKEFNRMHIPNVAIVFGPSLMWPEEEELGNMAIDLMQQNLVVECLLVDFDQIFR